MCHLELAVMAFWPVLNLHNAAKIILKTKVSCEKFQYFNEGKLHDTNILYFLMMLSCSHCFRNSYSSPFRKFTDSVCSKRYSCQVTYYNFKKSTLSPKFSLDLSEIGSWNISNNRRRHRCFQGKFGALKAVFY